MNREDFKSVTERFLRYIKIDTEADEACETFPSTEKQKNLARILRQELSDLGIQAEMDETYGYVYAQIPSTIEDETDQRNQKVIAFISHMDTAPAFSGKDVNPQIVKNYQGQILPLCEGVELNPQEFPDLKKFIGQDLITTDGTTLLGADDKAGVAEIMTMAAYFMAHPEQEHGPIAICFTPDEEVGRGVDFIDLERVGADFAYTVDGGILGELEYENFNAAGATAVIHGKSVHPGSAKNTMINASEVAMELASALPADQTPRYTEGYEGFFFLEHLEGEIELAKMDYIIRDHDKDKFEEKKFLLCKIAADLNRKYGEGTVELSIKDSYYNMSEKIQPYMFLIDRARECMEELDITPIISPIRGGTDGARLSFMGVPTPNLCAGGLNFHGKYEFISIQSMETIAQLITIIAQKVFTEVEQ